MTINRAKVFAINFLSNKRWFYASLVAIFVLQICSLNLFMQPWFDEVVFADISNSVANIHKFILNINPLSTNNNEIFFYGPVFFYMQACIIKYCGLSAFLFRLPVYLCGVFASLVLAKIIFLITGSTIYERVFLVFFSTNLLICGSLSCGRMEMVALLFVALSLYFFLKFYLKRDKGSFFINLPLSGIIFSLANLTTPRSAFLYLLFATPLLQLLLDGVRKKNLGIISFAVLHPFLSFGIPYFFWFRPHLGDVSQIFNYITPVAKTQLSLNNTRADLNSLAWFLIDLSFVVIILFKKIKVPAYVYGFFVASFIFIKVVIPWSYHHGIIIPFSIGTGLLFTFYVHRQAKISVIRNLLMTILCVQALLMMAKYIIIWIESPSRNPHTLETIVDQYIPRGSKVIGHYSYYYACMKDGCQFRSIEDNVVIATGKPVPLQEKVDYLVNIYSGEYIIARDDEMLTLQPFLGANKFKKIAAIQMQAGTDTFWEKCRKKLGLRPSFYNDSIFMRCPQ